MVAARWLRNCVRSCRHRRRGPRGHAASFVQRGLQWQAFAEQHEQVAPVDQQGEKLAEAAADIPPFRDEQPEP